MSRRSFSIFALWAVLCGWGSAGGPAAEFPSPPSRHPSLKATVTARAGNRRIQENRRNAVDAGDAYMTRAGPRRRLLRRAGDFAVLAPSPTGADALIPDLTKTDGPLAGYAARRETGGWVVFSAPDRERETLLRETREREDRLERLRGRLETIVNPVFVDPDSGLIVVVERSVVIRLQPDVDSAAYFGPHWARASTLPGTRDQFVLPLDVQAEAVFADVDARMRDPRVVWAEPLLLKQVVRHSEPDDPLFYLLWHLHNTGQHGGVSGADVDALAAWDLQKGSESVVIAIIDDGVQLDHPDLAPSIFVNPGESLSGQDDDNNGYVDDIHGWDFYFNNNNPNPKNQKDYHGTPVAGLAAAAGDNDIGITGMAYGCKILPIKVWDGNALVAHDALANALRYAAGVTTPDPWRGADILSMSISFPQSELFDDAVNDASTLGRGGRGCALFVATGNQGSGWYAWQVPNIPAGTRTFRFEYAKNTHTSHGLDTVWLDDISFPGAGTEGFEGDTFPPPGWTTGGHAPWTHNTDPTYVRGTGERSARSGDIGDSQTTYLQVTKTISAGSLRFYAWTSTEANDDVLNVYIDGSLVFVDPGGVNYWQASPSYPASHSNALAVGASTDFDFRADYSQFGQGLEFVAPSSGGAYGVVSTDRTGDDGYTSDDYTGFGGTSAATPIAAGIGALVLSRNPTLTRNELRSILRQSCDKIGGTGYAGGEPGTGGWNEFYGYGRLNARLAMENTMPLMPPAIAAIAVENQTFTLWITNLALNAIHDVDRSPSLSPPSWSNVATFTVGTPGTNWNDMIEAPHRFYRIRSR